MSLSGALTQAVLQRELARRITGPGAAKIISQIRQSSNDIRHLDPVYRDAAVASYQRALHAVFVCAIVLSVIGVLASLGIREVDMSGKPAQPQEEEDDDEAVA